MKTTFDFYMDPGHGWAKVPRKLLSDLGIADKISSYSYQRENDVYLEEARDMHTFINAMRGKGVQCFFRDKIAKKSSKIRSYHYYVKST